MFDHEGTLDTSEYGHTLGANAGIRDSSLTKHAKSAAWALNSRARPVMDEGWVCWPSISCIMRDTGVSRSQVKRALAELRAAGLVEWQSGDQTSSNHYTLDFVAMMDLRKPAKVRRG